MYNNITSLTKLLSVDSYSPQVNFDLGLEYERIGQLASALGFYLRAAEYGYETHKDLTYICLLKIGICLDKQGGRDYTTTNSFLQAISYMPERPEAYYYLAKFYEVKNNWQESYTFYTLANKFSDKSIISKQIDYDGKIAIELGLSTTAYYIGRAGECVSILQKLISLNNIPEKYFEDIFSNAINAGIRSNKIAIILPVRNNNSYRAERLKTCLSSWREQTEGLSSIHIIIDDDEVDVFKFLEDYTFVTVHVRARMKLIPKINSVAVLIAGIYDYLAFVGDDIVFKTKWESTFIEYFKSVPVGLAYANTMDREDVGNFASHPVITSNMVRELGFYGCPAVDHTYFDNFWMDICRDLGHTKYFEDILWDHSRIGYAPDDMYWQIVEGQKENQIRYNQYKEYHYDADLQKIKDKFL